MTPLQSAVVMNDVPRLKFLIEHGADLRLTGDKGITALEYAKKIHKAGSESWDTSEIIQLLSDAEKSQR
ncbi:MAG: ankyrin repeat domain-containing protein [Ectothiorhodospiraceae bacterium]|nr:ankyrin repeat domain-containing protein [Ectothiorhodospiraceae bacterium]